MRKKNIQKGTEIDLAALAIGFALVNFRRTLTLESDLLSQAGEVFQDCPYIPRPGQADHTRYALDQDDD